MSRSSEQQTHFGFKQVPESEKAGKVGEVFTQVADKYDIMNDVMSFGVHRLWKHFACAQSGLRKGGRVLDVAAGSGDLSRVFRQQVGDTGSVIMTDINPAMLMRGRDVMTDHGAVGNVSYAITDAEKLAFDDNYFNCVSISFGLRNVTRIPAALESMYRVLKPGGKLLILEFSKPPSDFVSKLYDLYSFNVIPKMGGWVANDEDSYQYLVESIRKHPDQETLASMMKDVGFERVDYHNLSQGVVALHTGYKF